MQLMGPSFLDPFFNDMKEYVEFDFLTSFE